MHLLLNESWEEPRVFPPVYSDAVYSALHVVLGSYREQEKKLEPKDRLCLAAAIQLIAIAGLLEAQVRTSVDHALNGRDGNDGKSNDAGNGRQRATARGD